jgi:hypothetical protein
MRVPITEVTDLTTVRARRAALHALDVTVRAGLVAAADRWLEGDSWTIDLTAYNRVYPRLPETGGHWTLFSARLTEGGHEVASLTVSAEFEGVSAVDLRVHGVTDALAGACTPVALAEALVQSGGPLRQYTPLGADMPLAREAGPGRFLTLVR